MNEINILEKLNSLIKGEGKIDGHHHNITYYGEIDLHFYANMKWDHIEIINTIYASDKKWQEISAISFQSQILNIISECKKENRIAIISDIRKLNDRILNLEEKKYLILKEIRGLEFKGLTLPIKLGGFTLYSYPHNKDIVKKDYPGLDVNVSSIWENGVYLVGREYTSKDQLKVKQDGLRDFAKFENICNYVVADLLHQVAIITPRSERFDTTKVLTYHESSFSEGLNVNQWIQTNIFYEGYFEIIGNKEIFELLDKNNRTNLENRILSAAEWIGKALIEKNHTRALLQYVFALESLFQENVKEIVSPSINYQIGEALCFILGKTKQDRIQLIKDFKNLYTKRSNIVHGGSNLNVNEGDLFHAQKFSKGAIQQLLTDMELKNLKDIKELRAWIDNKKYN